MNKSILTVLYLEDNKMDIEMVKAILDDQGYQCKYTVVDRRDSFTSALITQRFDIIFADYTLPSFDGISALEIAKELAPHIPFIFISGTMGEENAIKTLTNGATDYVLKQGLTRLLPAINRALNESEQSKKRKAAETLLTQNERRFRLFYENTPLGYLSFNEDGLILEVNNSWLEMFGYERDEVIGKFLSDFIANKNHQEIQEFLNNFLEQRKVVNYELEIKSKNKNIIIVSYDGRIGYDEKGQFLQTHGVMHDVTEMKMTEKRLKSSLAEKELLLKEVHHRVKNNMQVMASLINLQSQKISDTIALEIFENTKNRINAMQLLHQNLYKSDNVDKINFKIYVTDLTKDLFDVFDVKLQNVTTILDIEEDVVLDIDQGLPCGLIINELLTNALKHAFNGGLSGYIKIEIKKNQKKKDWITILILNNGLPLPNDFSLSNQKTLGLQLVSTLVTQLEGDIEVVNTDVIGFRISFCLV